MNESGEIEEIELSGRTDIVKLTSSDELSYDGMDFVVELKLPFHAPLKRVSMRQNELVCQLLGMWSHSSKERTSVAGGVTDLFNIMLAFSYSCDKRKMFVVNSASVVSTAEEYLLHLCLLFVKEEYIKSLLVETLLPTADANIRPINNTKSSSNRPSAINQKKSSKMVHYFDTAQEEKEEEELRSEAALRHWYACHYVRKELLTERNLEVLANAPFGMNSEHG